jgi:HK97 gp10 family phage protein
VVESQVNGPALEKRLQYNPDVTEALNKMGKAIAHDAAVLAPKETTAGARSIHHEVGFDTDGAYVRVSWDRRHFYMWFLEAGTSKKSATPFLRPAAAVARNL